MRENLLSVPQTLYFCMIHVFTCSVLCEGPAVALGPPAIQRHLTSLALHVLRCEWAEGASSGSSAEPTNTNQTGGFGNGAWGNAPPPWAGPLPLM